MMVKWHSFIKYLQNYVAKYQIIIKPIKANKNPPILNWLVENFSMVLSIFFIFDGNKAYKAPSMNNKRPIAMMSSFIRLFIAV